MVVMDRCDKTVVGQSTTGCGEHGDAASVGRTNVSCIFKQNWPLALDGIALAAINYVVEPASGQQGVKM
jgi:hypothetical protein